MTFQKMKFFPWDFQNFSLGNGKSKIPFSLGIPMMGIPRAETLLPEGPTSVAGAGNYKFRIFLKFIPCKLFIKLSFWTKTECLARCVDKLVIEGLI